MKKLIAALLLAVMLASMFAPAMAEGPGYATTKSFIETLDQNELGYTFTGKSVSTGEEHIAMENEDENFAYTFHVYFNEDEDRATVFIWNIITFGDENFGNVLRAVNNLNYSYKYVRFYVDESDNTVTCAMNIILQDQDDAGDIVLEGLLRIASILKVAYPHLVEYNK